MLERILQARQRLNSELHGQIAQLVRQHNGARAVECAVACRLLQRGVVVEDLRPAHLLGR
jgi:hypothetical protein